MSCASCREACAHPDKKERASKAHAAMADVCGCENFSMSDLSPGPVADGETLYFVVSDPKSLLGASLNPSALIQVDRGGLSILREAADNDEFALTIQELKERAQASNNTEWYFYGVCTFKASTVRYDGGERFLCIYDTAMAKKKHHADIMGPDLKQLAKAREPNSSEMSKSQKERDERARIKKMIDKIGPVFVPAARFRSGRFIEHARPTH